MGMCYDYGTEEVDSMPKLEQVRRQKLLSQQDLANKAGIARSTVFLIEAGRTKPRLSVMRRICEALGVAPGEIDEFKQAIEGTGESKGKHEAA